MAVNLGNVVGLLRSQTAPTKKYVLWAKILNPSFPDIVELHYWDQLANVWVPLLDPTHQYWLRPVIDNMTTTPPVSPTEGDRWMLPASSIGEWAGKDDQIATWKGGAWQYSIPLDGYIVSVRSQPNMLYDYRGIYGAGGGWAVNDFSIPVTGDNYIPLVQKGAAAGVAPLDSSTKLLSSYLYPDTIVYNPANPSDWPPSTNTIKKALDYLITVVGTGGGGGGGGSIPGLEDVLDENGDGGGLPITNVAIDAALITSGLLNVARIPQAALERMYVYGGVETLPQNAGLTTGNVQNGDTVKMVSSGLVYAVIDDTQLNQAAGFTAYTVGSAATVPWSGVTSTPSVAGSGGYGIQATGPSVLGVASAGLAYVTSITASADDQVFRRSGGIIGFGSIIPGAVTVANTTRLMGRFAVGSGPMQEITIGSGLSLDSGTGVLSSTGTLSGTGAAGTVAFWSGTNTLTTNASFSYDATNTILKAPRLQTTFTGTPTLGVLDGEIYYSSTLLDYRARINGFWVNLTKADEIVEPATTLTLNESHRNSIIRFTANTTVTVTLPPGLSTRFATTLVKSGTGDVNLVTAGTYVGITNSITIQNTAAMVYHSGSNIWRGYGSLGAGSSGGGGTGTVTNVASGNLAGIFTSSVANQSTTPAISYTLVNANANQFLGGPATGAAATPTYRSIVLDDLPGVNETLVAGTTYTILPSDNKKVIRCTSASGCTITLPDTTTTIFPAGFSTTVYRNNGAVTFSPASVSVNMEGTGASIPTQYGYASIWIRATNTYALGGLLNAATGGGGTTYTYTQGVTETAGVVSVGGAVSGTRNIFYPATNGTGIVNIGSNGGGAGAKLAELYLMGNSVTMDNGAGQRIIVDGTGISIRPSSAALLGDLWYYGPTGYLVRIPIGASAQVLTVSSGVPVWSTPVGGGGTTYTFTNGLQPLTGTNVGLGGALTQTTDIVAGTQIFSVTATTGAVIGKWEMNGSTKASQFLTQLASNEYYRFVTNTTLIEHGYTSAASTFKKITIDKAVAGIQVIDTYSSKGLFYAADYSAGFTAYSLIHRDWAVSHLGGKNVSSTLVNPLIGQNGYAITWDNTGQQYTLSALPVSGGGGSVTSVSASVPSFLTVSIANASTTPAITIGYHATNKLPISQGGTGIGIIGTAGQQIRVASTGTSLEYFTPSATGITDGNKGDITVSSSGTVWAINAATVTFADIVNSAAAGLSVLGRAAASAGSFAEIQASVDGYILRRSGATLGFGTITTAGITNSAVTYAKIQNVSATSRFMGRITAGAGVMEELTPAQATSLLNVFTASLKGLVNPPTTATGKFLRDDNTWQVVAGGGGISNTAVPNEIPQTSSSGGNLIATGIFYTATGNITMGSLSAATTGTLRRIDINGSAPNIGLALVTKGAGDLTLSSSGLIRFINNSDLREVSLNTLIPTFNTWTCSGARTHWNSPLGYEITATYLQYNMGLSSAFAKFTNNAGGGNERSISIQPGTSVTADGESQILSRAGGTNHYLTFSYDLASTATNMGYNFVGKGAGHMRFYTDGTLLVLNLAQTRTLSFSTSSGTAAVMATNSGYALQMNASYIQMNSNANNILSVSDTQIHLNTSNTNGNIILNKGSGAGYIMLSNLQTSSAGLPTGALWTDPAAGYAIKRVP